MNNLKIVIVTLVMALLTAGCFGPAKINKTPLEGASQLHIVINRPGSMTPMSVSPQSHDERQHFLRVIAWKQDEGIKVMRDVDAQLHQDGQVTVQLNLPLNTGYRVMAVEWVEVERAAWGEPVFMGVTQPVDIITEEPVIVTINMKSVLENKPILTVNNPVEIGGKRITGSIVIPHDFNYGSLGSQLLSYEPNDYLTETVCSSITYRPGASYSEGVVPVVVDWSVYTPILQEDMTLTCTFILAVEILEGRPEGIFAPPGEMRFVTEPITITIKPPGGRIGF